MGLRCSVASRCSLLFICFKIMFLYFVLIFRLLSDGVFGAAPVLVPYIYIYIYICVAFRVGLRRDLRRDFVSCIFYISCSCHAFCMQLMPLLMQANHFFSLNKMHTSHLRLPRLVCTSHSYCFLVGDFLYISLWSPLYFPYISKPSPAPGLRQSLFGRCCWHHGFLVFSLTFS